jgi:hypothetical protein
MTAIDLTRFPTPNLDQSDRTTLIEALQDHLDGKTVDISVDYHKVTSSKARIQGEDYKGILGLSGSFLTGRIKRVAYGKNGFYVLLDAAMVRRPLNSKGEVQKDKLGWTAIKGEGIDALLGTETLSKSAQGVA